jgi:hypothetical protein
MRHPDVPQLPSNLRVSLARRCLQLAFVLLVVGLVLTLVAVLGERRATANAAWRDPADAIQPESIAFDLALLSLAGVPDEQVLALSIEMQELATAHAILALGLDLTDFQRMNGWLWLAFRYQEAGQAQRAARAYRLAGHGAILGQDLSDLSRTETLLSVGRELIELHDEPGARFFLGQAALIAANAPQLTAHHRRTLLEQLVPAILRAGGGRDDWLDLAKAVDHGTVGAGLGAVGQTGGRAAVSEGGEALARAQDARRAAAAAWLGGASDTQVEEARGREKDLHQALLAALSAEEAAVNQYVARSGETPGLNLGALETRLRWLSLKRRIAAGGVGAGLVPQWESNREEIDAALAAAWSRWLALQADPGVSGVNGSFHGLKSAIVLEAVVAAYWGLYPDAPVADLLSQAQSISGIGGLHLAVLGPGTPPLVGWSK